MIDGRTEGKQRERRVDAGRGISSLERAAFEQFHLVGTKESFDESYKLLEGLTALRPKIIQALLRDCSSVKTKRLFLYVAEHLGYAWFRKLDLSKVDLSLIRKAA